MMSIGSHRRKYGRRAVALLPVVALAGAAVLAAGAGTAGASSTSAVTSVRAASTASAASAASTVRVVAPGERIAVAASELWLKEEGLYVVAPKVTDDLEVVEVGDVLPGKVSTLAWGDAAGVLYAGVHRGPLSPTAKVTIKVGARTLQAEVVALAGTPGWGAYYAFDATGDLSAKPSITVQS
ncbi:hypothetical protein OG875_12555 [Streptomyces sp. NBC_01498]|uniref:hypothetical protein n=1 Tax=Streptomyces sp. NBC_01498 TaxID=2975870 RepID=UPI002E7B233E|nr:hypothetical protein [Streptomyces sp. NBC_01498]WTL25348.1 hypothetical protein OG875_12555 [Streptomyces sp. NBC_01498]